MEMSGQLHATAALLPVKELPVPIWQKNLWSSEPVWTRWRRQKYPYPCRE